MKWFILILAVLIVAGCASTRSKFWAWGSDKVDEMDGTDDVPSVVFANQTGGILAKADGGGLEPEIVVTPVPNGETK